MSSPRAHATDRPYGWIYLASQSPRRRQLLDQIGVPHRLLLPTPGEDAEALEALRPGEAPARYVQRVTRAKLAAACARWAAAGLPPAPILCADTTVALGRTIFGKPEDAADARAILGRLSGATHRVLTAVAIAWPDAGPGRDGHADAGACMTTAGGAEAGCDDLPVLARLNVSHVQFASIPATALEAYVASGDPMGKAGAYAIQSAAAAWIPHIRGSYSGIMGLPLAETAELLRAVGRFETLRAGPAPLGAPVPAAGGDVPVASGADRPIG